MLTRSDPGISAFTAVQAAPLKPTHCNIHQTYLKPNIIHSVLSTFTINRKPIHA